MISLFVTALGPIKRWADWDKRSSSEAGRLFGFSGSFDSKLIYPLQAELVRNVVEVIGANQLQMANINGQGLFLVTPWCIAANWLLKLSSMINHSCTPNALVSTWDQSLWVSFYTSIHPCCWTPHRWWHWPILLKERRSSYAIAQHTGPPSAESSCCWYLREHSVGTVF
jgi:hypothetical protein